MKKFILLSAMGLLFFVGLTSMVSMDPPYNATQCQADCDIFVEAGVFATQGDCRSACSTCTNPSSSIASVANCLCKVSLEFFGEEHFGFKNHGQCVKAVKGGG